MALSSDVIEDNMFSSLLLWFASQLSYLAVLAEAAAEYPLHTSSTVCIILVTSCLLWYCFCSLKKPPKKGLCK